ncbi:MAG: hypothetical protein DWC10_05105 [Candidatus Poseidoniales archaeon]|nr:MAG: hypothetical protein DWC10_05105 [Candidatus Poseidoniales archaeon]
MEMTVNNAVTSEHVPAGQGLPNWLQDAFISQGALDILVLHPNELHRRQTLEVLQANGSTPDPQQHLTINRLVRLLHVDLRLPVLLDDEASNLMALHARCVEAAEAGHFPFLHVPGAGAWSLNKTRRLQRLHSEVIGLRQPFAWENEPGVSVYHQLALEHEQSAGGTLPSLVMRHVVEALEPSQDTPFHLSDVRGMVILNTAPDFTELEQDLLLRIAAFCPVHQLINPGSFRLGYHGAYLLDEPPCSTEQLPSWLPEHRAWTPSDDGWQSPQGEQLKTRFTRITVDERRHVVNAALSLVQAFREGHDGSILIIDAAVKERASVWSSALASIGLSWQREQRTLDQQPLHHAIMRAARLGQGMSAWSHASLQSLFFSNTLPFVENMFPDLTHPTQDGWRPRPDPTVLDDIARQFHVLGGPGALARWLGVLSQARPSFAERRPAEKAQALEETQWWLACLLHAWRPLLAPEDVHLTRSSLVGCTSGDDLPLPVPSGSGMAWLGWLISTLDMDVLRRRRAPFDVGLGALQHLIDGLNLIQRQQVAAGLPFGNDGLQFVELMELVGALTSLPTTTPVTSKVHVVTPEEALGCSADVVILAGMDVDAWSMKSPIVPWLDAQAQLELGIFQTDLLVRRGRHHLRHLLNAAPHVVVFDSTPEEGGGPSAPLAEWLNDVRRSNAWDDMRDPPSFVPEELVHGDAPQRAFSWVVREEGHGSWLTPHLYRTMEVEDGVRLMRQGHAGRDRRQQLGLDLHAGLPYEGTINHPVAALDAQEAAIQSDRYRRQPSPKDVGEGETFAWANRTHLLSTDALTLRPTTSALNVEGVNAQSWPHLGYRNDGPISLTVDPRPLPPYAETELSIAHRFGRLETPYEREVWSPSRLEGWLKCPRQAWMKQVLAADDVIDTPTEDIDTRVRGQVVHETEAAILQGHGVPLGGEMTEGIQPLHLGPMGQGEAGWEAILAFLTQRVHWLGRANAVSVHRTRDLVDASPEEWQALQEGSIELPPRGRLARLLEADLSLHHAAPVAVEWTPISATERSVLLETGAEGEASTFRLFGYADRVDVLALNDSQRDRLIEQGVLGEASFDTPFPLDGTARAAQRLVVIRDLKTVPGPAPKYRGLRHMRCLFEDLQLALYARAWEVLHPNDRVVGVGASEIGEVSTHYVELDSDLKPLDASLSIGEITRVFEKNFPAQTADGEPMTPFRRWMAERLLVAQRAVDTAAAGVVNPTPGSHCKYCSLAHSCAVSTYDGGDF